MVMHHCAHCKTLGITSYDVRLIVISSIPQYAYSKPWNCLIYLGLYNLLFFLYPSVYFII